MLDVRAGYVATPMADVLAMAQGTSLPRDRYPLDDVAVDGLHPHGAVAVALREVFRHPRVSGVLSFPSRADAQDGYPRASSTSDAPAQARRGSQPAFDSGEGATDRAATEG